MEFESQEALGGSGSLKFKEVREDGFQLGIGIGALGEGGEEFGEDGAAFVVGGFDDGTGGEAGEPVEKPSEENRVGAEGVDLFPAAQGDLGGEMDGAAGG